MSAGKPLRVLVVDDEPLARQRVEDLLRDTGAIVVGTADSGSRALEAIRTLQPDLVFLDVQMPGKTGLDVVRELGEAMPATVFVTAYDKHALEAFEVAAVDYLVKPFDDERFEQAFARARRRIELDEVERLRTQLLAALQGERPPATSPPPSGADESAEGRGPRAEGEKPRTEGYLARIPVDSRGKIRVIPVDEIDYIVASGPYAELQVGDRRHIIREAMQTLEDRLDPSKFVRIHRSVIVRIDLIDSLLRSPGGDYEVQLRNGQKLRVSRSRREELEKRLGL